MTELENDVPATGADRTTASPPEGLSRLTGQPFATMQVSARLHPGPLPPPDQLAAYARIDPKSVDGILRQAEVAADHTRTLERLSVVSLTKDAFLQRLLPFASVVLFTLCSTAIAIWANEWLGVGAFLATVSAVVIAYLRPPPGDADGGGSDRPSPADDTAAAFAAPAADSTSLPP